MTVLSLWLQALQIWKEKRVKAGLPAKIPKRGTDEHKEVIAIMEKLKGEGVNRIFLEKSGEVKSPAASSPKKAPKKGRPKVQLHLSTTRVGDSSDVVRATEQVREQKKAAEREIVKAEKEKEKLEERVERKQEKIQERIVKILATLQKGKLKDDEVKGAHDEIQGLQKELGQLTESADDEKKRLAQIENLARIKQETVNAIKEKRVQEEDSGFAELGAKVAGDQFSKLPGMIQNLGKHQQGAVAKVMLAAQSGKDVNFGKTKGPDHLRKLAGQGAIIVLDSKDQAERFTQVTEVPNFFAYKIEDGDGRFVTVGQEDKPFEYVAPGQPIPGRGVDIVPPRQVAEELAVQNEFQQLRDAGAPPQPDQPMVPIHEVAPNLAAMMTHGDDAGRDEVVIDPEQAANVVDNMVVAPDVPTEDMNLPVLEGDGLAVEATLHGGYLLPGSRNSGPLNIGRAYKGPAVFSKLAKKTKGGMAFDPSASNTNEEAVRLAEEMKLESARLRELARNGVQLLISRPGQSINSH